MFKKRKNKIANINEKIKTPFVLEEKNIRVYTEYGTDMKRRIDIVIEDGKTFIPIEVKIYAKDQENQVSLHSPVFIIIQDWSIRN